LYELLLKEKKAQLQSTSPLSQQSTIPQRQEQGPAPASFPQQRLWVVDQLEGGRSFAYNVHITVQFSGVLDIALLERCVNEVVKRHESLRTHFVARDDGMPVQVVLPQLRLVIPVEDISHLSKHEQDAEVERRTSEESQRLFDLARGPLLRGKVLRLGPENHVALVTMHHMVTDRWSLGVFVRELMAFYAAEVAGQKVELPELAIQYSDFAVWQRERMQGEKLRTELDFWKQHLRTLPPPLELPTDRPRPPVQTYRGSRQFVTLPVALTRALKELSQQEGATLFMTLLATFQTLLHRHSRQTDITVGSPIAGRGVPELEALIGFFVNTLVLRNDLDGDPTFRELLRRAKEVCMAAYAHQELPFEKLVEELRPPRDRSRHPLFQVMFSFQNTPRQDLSMPGLQSTYLLVDPGSAKFDLLLELREDRPDEIFGWLEYNTDLFDVTTVQRLRGHFYTLLGEVAANPDRRLSKLPLLMAEEQRQLLVEFRGPEEAYPRDACLHALFEAQVARTPDAEAVWFGGTALSYAQLDARANQLAHHLRSLGVGPETCVGVCLERSLELVVALLGVLKAGAAYVPLDPSYPRERLAWMLEDTSAPVLLTQRHLTAVLPPHAARMVYLDSDWEAVAREPGTRPVPLATPEALAYVIFTSGSTGRPKGGMNTHAGIVNRLLWMQQEYGLTPADTVLQKTPFSFDVSVWEFFWPLLVGARLVVARPGGHQDPAYLAGLIQAQRVTTLHFVPSMLSAFLDQPGVRDACAPVRRIICSGEALGADLARRCMERIPGAGLHNLYGPTEAAVDVTYWACRPDDARASVPIGRPVANTRIHLLDAHLSPVPVGVPGELYIAGIQVGRGYLARPELTAERFVPDPFSPEPGARMYRTGDLARWLPDGTVDYLGRLDFQVKVRGLRIELGEIEAVLAALPGVRQAVVLAREDSAGDKRLVAYVVPQKLGTVDTGPLREALRRTLPEYMVPSAFVVLEAFPLSPSGKLDRKALPAPDAEGAARTRDYVAPRTSLEATLADIWAQVLQVRRVGVDDNFFELGGHSLLATQVVSRIRAALGVELPLGELFAGPTVAVLAERLGGAAASPSVPPILALPPDVRRQPLPLSFAQQRLWFFDQLQPGNVSYNLPFTVRMAGRLDADALGRALHALVRRHEVLRTAFRTTQADAVQHIFETGDCPFTRVDLGTLSPEDRQARADQHQDEEAARPFDLVHGPLMRAVLLRMGEQEHLLLLTMHHIVSDAWSMGVLVREVAALYEAFSQGQPSPLPALPLQYADYAVWQHSWLQGEALEAQLDYWRQRLAGAPQQLELPTDFPRPAVQTFRGGSVPVLLSRELSATLNTFCHQRGTTPFMALLGAFQAFLARYCGQEDFIVGSPIAGRRFAELEGLIGFFVNTLALRARAEGSTCFEELLSRVRAEALGAHAHQDIPFEKLVEALAIGRALDRPPLFQVFFALQNAPLSIPSGAELSLQPLMRASTTTRFELELNLSESPEGFSGQLIFNADLFLPETAQRMARYYVRFLEELLARPKLPLNQLPLMPEDERHAVLSGFNRALADFPSQSTLPEVFSRVVSAHADSVALEFAEQRLTYRQLDERANQLAHLLVARGVKADAPVALALERSVELVVSLLAILKAGGAYLPLDTSYPRERLAQMMEEAQPVLLLTHSSLAGSIPASLPVVLVDSVDSSSQPVHAPAVALRPGHLAYIDFTSGSTGRPKGVAVSHRNVLRTVCNAPYADVSAGQSFLLIAPISFDASTLEVWGPLLNGGRLVVFPASSPSDLDLLSSVLKAHSVSTLHLTSGLFSQMVENRLDGLRGVKQLLTGGDVVSAPHVRRVLEELRVPVTACYGPTEGTLFTSCFRMTSAEQVPASIPIGTPITATQVYLLDAQGQPVPVGVPGELFIGGEGLARGYVQRPDLTAERFVPNPFSTTPGARLYRTGDLARWRQDGVLEFLGRKDFQVKIRGFRIELAEVEAALLSFEGVREAVALAREDVPGDKRLVGYVTADASLDLAALRSHLRLRLPEYMVPSAVVALPALPLAPNGKVDRRALPPPDAASTGRQGRFVEPGSQLEEQLVSLWSRELGADRVGVHDHFFEELGGGSLSAVRVTARMRDELKREVKVVWLFEHPTVHALALRLERESGASHEPAAPRKAPGDRAGSEDEASSTPGAIAIVGMAGRFPGARSTEDFWRNLRAGVESISRFSPEELEHLPGLPEGMELWQHPGFVPAGGVIDGISQFDHGFFDLTLREAQWMDPQQRLFLQCAWSALEDAGIDPARSPGPVSLYAGASDSGYTQLVRQTAPLDPASFFEIFTTTTHEGLATKASYKLRLTGESVLVYTACSTGLVAVHMACQSLLAGRSRVALAGATRLGVPQRTGYVYQEGMISSPDGHCRAFDAKAQGTVAANGVAAVVLKRLEDARRDGDSIYAVIRATAINNDGHLKSGYTAPSVQGQSEVITEALSRAGVRPADIGYVEAHGTATPLGDPIEVAALHRAYGLGPEHRGTIALASLKSNVGHLDTVAGLAGLIKAALALHHGEIPPSLHFEKPNPQLDFDSGPFFVNTALRPWPRGAVPRRAAVSSFGIGGTNAHAVLEEAPPPHTTPSLRPQQLVLLSARAPEALEAAAQRLASHLKAQPGLPLADVAFSHSVGRRGFEYRRALVAHDTQELVTQLGQPYTPAKVKDLEAARRRRVAFVFPGQGAQQAGMGWQLYTSEPAFRAHLDACLALLDGPLRARVRALLEGAAGPQQETGALLADTRVALPALFSVEYSLARTWMDWGVRPYAVLGHSFGEYAAACLAGVLPLEDALKLAAARGELMHRMPPGAMLAVALPEAQVVALLSGRLALAAINAPDRCVVAGPVEEVERLQQELKRQEVGAVRMPAPHAFHSADVEPLMPELARVVASLRRAEPSLRYASSVTGTWAQTGELAAPRYWADQMRQPVRFAQAVGALLEQGCGVLLEVGPAQDLTPLVRACLGEDRERVRALSSLRRGGASSHAGLMQTLGELWASGLEPDWDAFHAHERRQRLHLPTYPFQEKHCWVDAARRPLAPAAGQPVTLARAAPADVPAPAARPPEAPSAPLRADAPRGDIEERVAALWRERLGVEFVGREEDFLEAGGNSLTAAQLLTQLRDAFGVQLPLAALFEAPTVAGIAARIEPLLKQAPAAAAPVRAPPLVPLPRTEPLALSFVQERCWRLEQYLPGLSAYNMPVVLRLEGGLDAGVLERCLQEVVHRHEILRTTYDTVDGRPVQRFHASMRLPFEVVDLTGLPPEQREEEALRRVREDALRPFDLVNGPVFRAALLRLTPELHILRMCVHHIVFDTLSVFIVIQELGQLYGAFSQGRPSPLPALPLQYADFGAWQRRVLAERLLPEQEPWWRQRLAGMPRQLDLQTDRPRPEVCPLTSARMMVELSPALSQELPAFSKREGLTSYMTVLAAWQAVLHRYTGQPDIVIGTPIANRTRAELQPLVGYVAHAVAFRAHLGDDPTFRELAERVRQEVMDAQARPDVPYEYLAEEVLPGKDIGRSRMADAVLVYYSGLGAGTPLELAGVRGSLMELPDMPVQWGATLADLSLLLNETPGRVHGTLEYATELFDAGTARRMVEHLNALLEAALARPDERISRLPLATRDARERWPRPAGAAPFRSVVAHLVERASQAPEAPATTLGGQSWSRAELVRRARALATRLRGLGVQPGEPVAVCLRPSPAKLAALWGVLEAGAAPVVLSPTAPGGLAPHAPEGARAPVLITSAETGAAARLEAARVLHVEAALEPLAPSVAEALPPLEADALAWLLPASAGQPAWVLSHRALAEVFSALDERLHPTEGGTWLVAAEATEERPELEALWALSRGLRVVFPPEDVSEGLSRLGAARSGAMELSLSYFANDEDTLSGPKYELLLEGAKLADAHGFSAVWTPERHFHAFGGLYPQPAVVSAALASTTRNLRLRAGSVVLPLHDPLLVAEQWSVVDNLSGGRVGLSVASGWHVQDFTFSPGNYEDRRKVLMRNLETLRAIWRGEKQRRPGGGGVTVEVALRPKPVQRELPVWLTATANPETFRLAGELGAGVLTGLLAHSLEELKPKVALYREAWRRNGHPGHGHITCMLHTFIGEDDGEVLRTVRQPLLGYFRSSVDIMTSLLAAQGHQGELAKLSEEDITGILEHTFEHHARQTGLLGTVESGLKRLRDVREADVDEVACLIDFGLEPAVVLEGLKRLATLRERMEQDAGTRREQARAEGERSASELLALARQSGPVVLHASARLARTLAALPEAREALGSAGALLVEGASPELATALHRAVGVEVLLAGGAGSEALLPRAPGEHVPAGQQPWVLDEAGQPVPPGVVGELALAGAGVPARLWRAGEEEPRWLVPHPLEPSARLYRTGRHARMRADGRVEHVSLPARKAPAPSAPRSRPAAQATPPPSIPLAPRDQPLPLSFAQQRFWYLQQLDPASVAYNNPSNFRLRGVLDIPALQSALDELVRRHEVLRTTYVLTDSGAAVQRIHPAGGQPMPLEEVPGATPEEREAWMLRQCQQLAALPFDLERGPLIRTKLLRLGAQEHVLSTVFHHSVSDAWCTLVLARELTALYASFCAGLPSPLPPLPIQYADYAAWQRRHLESPALEAQLHWWKEQLWGVPALELPTDRPRPAVQSYEGGSYRFQWASELAEPLLALGRREGATPFMVMMALFQAVLGRYADQEDFAVGTPTAGRNRPEVEGLMGCFINTLAFRSQLSGAPAFRELLGRVRQQALGAYSRQDAPFERLMELLQPPRDLSRSPVFQVILNVLNTPEADARPGALQLSQVEAPANTSRFDLGLEVWESRAGLAFRFEYSTALFDEATVARLAGHLTVLARAVVASPGTPLPRLPLLSEEERQQVLVAWNDTASDYPREACIHHLFEQQARLRPDAVALEFGDERLTYARLDARSNALAHLLRSRGVGPDALVAVCLERSVELIVSLLAILKAGGAYVPLDASYPAQRLGFMLEDAPPRLLLTTRAVRSRLPVAEDVPCLYVEELRMDGPPMASPAVWVHPRHLAYVDFTSGSTGRPKGVAVEHRGVMRLLHGARYAHLGPEETFLLIAPISFDASTLEVWGPLLFGGRLVIFPAQSPSDLELLGQVLQRHGVTTLHLTAGLFSQVVDLRPELLRGVRQLLTGGDVVSAPHVRRVVEGMSIPVTACYGPTESTLFTSTHRMTEAVQVGATIPIGSPIANTQVYVLDASLQPLPPGLPGELFIGGDGLARGYLSRPDLTAERFIPHPFSATPGERLYRTGDKARWKPDGVLEFLGRIDTQVKVRGYRIELAEVEAALLAYPGVREAVAVVRQEDSGDKRLVAYVTGDGQPLPPSELRAHVQQRLPEYMVPSAVVHLGVLPLTAQGKVDRKALPTPNEARPEAVKEYLAPRTPTETLLASVWAQLLGVARVGVQDNFFELGGHSLLATQLVARVRAAVQLELPLRELFALPTLAALAARIDAGRQKDAGLSLPPLVPAGAGDSLPLSFAQQRLWFLDRLRPGTSHYNMPLVLRIDGALDVAALERAFTELVRRHQSLRTTFQDTSGTPLQVIQPPAPFRLQQVDLRGHADGEAEALRLAAQEAARPFNLERGPLLRAMLMCLSDTRHTLVLTLHHIASDGWSMGVAAREMAALHQAFSSGEESPLPELPLQYSDYAVWQRSWLQGEALETQRAWWKQQLAGAPQVLELPTDFPRPAVQTFRGAVTRFQLPARLHQAIQAFCQKQGVTPFMVLLASFQALLARYCGQHDVVVGSPIAGRRFGETEGLIGFFVNTLALRARLEAGASFQQLLAQVRDTTLGAYDHQDVPFEKLVESLATGRSLDRTPLFQTFFALQNAPVPELSGTGVAFHPLTLDNPTARFELELNLTESPDGLSGQLLYNADLFLPTTAQRLTRLYASFLQTLLSRPQQPFHSLPLLPEEERHTVLEDFNRASTAFPGDSTLPEVFSRVVSAHAGSVALEFGAQRLTYAQLDARANQLAHLLVAQGVRPDAPVALALERSVELVVSLLAILKAGGAYLPLDTSYPRERLVQMMEDAQPVLLLTHSSLADSLPASLPVVRVDAVETSSQPTHSPDVALRPEHLAYIDFTSGSTGRPKGVAVSHRNVLRTVCNAPYADVSAGQSFLLLAPISFDASTLEVWGPLLNGGRLVVFPPSSPSDLDLLSSVLREHSVSTLHLTSGLFSQMVENRLDGLRGVKQLLTGGDVVSAPHVRRVLEELRIPVTACYGPTEGTLFTSCFRMTSPEQVPASIPIGTPITATQVYLLDSYGQPVPVGVPGELFIGGEGLARGYVRRPDLTAERFVPNPFSTTPGARLYRTGDLARWRQDGVLEFLGRKDFQVKVRGFRIELAEVEAALLSFEGVREAVALAREEVSGDKRLVGYVTADASLDTAALRTHLQQRLPEYMVPSALVRLDTFPLTANAKVDRKALPAPDARAELRPYVAPRNELEQQVADLWAEVLRVDRVGIHDNFFELGGHSLLATQLVARVRSTFDVELPLRKLFEQPTVEAMTLLILSGLTEGLDAEELDSMVDALD
jgi:natural product biosynthesis luciferase-like monooxygenase protein/amino acid adenylation domain-containing protein